MILFVELGGSLKFITSPYNSEISEFILKHESGLVVNFVYFSSLVLAENNFNYRESLDNSDVLLIDGVGMNLLARFGYDKKVYNNNGTDLIPILLEQCDMYNRPVFLYGAKYDVVKEVATLLSQKCKVVGWRDGYHSLDASTVPDNSVLLVGIGTPAQEQWINDNRYIINKKNIICLGVGGFFDFYSGAVKRAPRFIRDINMEFMYRLILNPSRHILKNARNIYIFYYVLRAKISRLI